MIRYKLLRILLPSLVLPCSLQAGFAQDVPMGKAVSPTVPPSSQTSPAKGAPSSSSRTPAAKRAPSSSSRTPAAKGELPPALTLDFQHFSGTREKTVLEGGPGNPARLTYGGELTVEAARVEGDLGDLDRQHYEADGGVRIHEADTTLLADRFLYDGAGLNNKGVADNATFTRPPYTLRAKQLDVTANVIDAWDADLTTAAPNTKPDFSIRAQRVTFFPARRGGEIRHGSIYLFRKRVLTISRIGFRFSRRERGEQGDQVLPDIGYRSSTGPYIAKNWSTSGGVPVHYHVLLPVRRSIEAIVSTEQNLYPDPSLSQSDITINEHGGRKDYLGALRKFATATRPPLPYGDPLLFHDFLTGADPVYLFPAAPRRALGLQELVGVHLLSTGRRRNDLFVSSLPEVSLSGTLPLFSQAELPAGADPDIVRRRLRTLAFTLHGQAVAGEYREQPTNIQKARGRYVIGLETRPLLIAYNTVIVPSVSWTSNSYSGSKSAYRYTQYSVDANHYFTDRSAVGVSYLVSNTVGDSPFNFDVLDTTRELDGRLQLGNHRLAVAFLTQFDLVQHNLIGYKLAVAPSFNGFIPVLTFDSRSRGFNFGVGVEGITF